MVRPEPLRAVTISPRLCCHSYTGLAMGSPPVYVGSLPSKKNSLWK